MKLPDKSPHTLSYALLIYMFIIVVLITFIPFEFRIPRELKITWSTNFTDFITNILLFIPIGFLFRLNRRQSKDILCINALILGLLLSLAIEFTQIFIPGRYPQFIDVITNGLGAWLGAISFVLLKSKLSGERTGKLISLELPLMNLVYLLIPLMWLNGLATGEEAARLWLLSLLGLCGTGAICSIAIYRFRHTGALFFAKLSLLTMSWFFIATLPALFKFPMQIAIFTISVGIIAPIIAGFPKKDKEDEQRFEMPTLKRILPLFGLYLLLLIIWPTTFPIADWQLNIDYKELAFNDRIAFTFRFIEFIAAFTLLGYTIAQMRGRKNESAAKTLGWIFIAALISSIVIEIIRGYPPLFISNTMEIVLITAAGLYGGVIYRLQLSSIQRLNF
jgi:glycopeptide antibiotics resistance protein